MPDHQWLPDLLLLSEHQDNWDTYLDAIYNSFRTDFIDSLPSFPGKPIRIRRNPIDRGKEATFWHLISEGSVEEERIPDLRRCEKIKWPKAMIASYCTDRVKCWKNVRGNQKKRTLIALPDFSYMVVLEERTNHFLLWTAYPIGDQNHRDKLEKEYQKYSGAK